MATLTLVDRSRLATAVTDSAVMTKRAIMHIPRVPELLFFSTLQPIMFVLLFSYVFGGAIVLPEGSYTEYLLAGIFVQTLAFSSASTSVGLAEDMQRGLIDRFRSLPMARSAVLVGRTSADIVRGVMISVIMVVSGYVVGWRVRDGAIKAIAAFGIILLFAYSITWVAALIGLSSRNAETANTAGFVWLFPLTFLSNAFAPVGSMPEVLQQIAIWNPVSSTVQAARELFGNPTITAGNAFPERYPALVSIGWSVLVLFIFIRLSVRKYAKVTSQ